MFKEDTVYIQMKAGIEKEFQFEMLEKVLFFWILLFIKRYLKIILITAHDFSSTKAVGTTWETNFSNLFRV